METTRRNFIAAVGGGIGTATLCSATSAEAG